jgi:menaquinone-specific isochorismate synthase
VNPICELRNALQAARERGRPDGLRIERVSVPCDLPALALLAGRSEGDRVFWRPRDSAQELAGLGTAHLISGDAEANPETIFGALAPLRAAAPADCRFFGGLAFGPADSATWHTLGTWRFVLPRFELNGTSLACNLVLQPGSDSDAEFATALRELDDLSFGEPATLPACISQRDLASRDQWMQAVSLALDVIASGTLTKVVLARRIRLCFDSPPSPAALVGKLSDVAGSCFVFLLESKGVAFLGASPERLYRREGDQLVTEALAGTRPRGDDPQQDAELAAALLDSEKERREHRNVVDGLASALRSLGCEFRIPDDAPSLRRLPRVQHLYQEISCPLPPGVGDAELVRALHPTSAVGGDPREAALEAISELERFDRGWYAGLVGAIGADHADFAVAIRSALLHGCHADLFGGAGIVAGSEPACEWEETVDKMAWLTRGVFA